MTFVVSAVITWFFWTRSKLSILTAEAETEKARAAAIEKQAMQAQLQLLQARSSRTCCSIRWLTCKA